MSDYRLEACAACGAVKLTLRTVLTLQRERDGLDRPEQVGGATVYVVMFCEPCERAYNESLRPPEPPEELKP